MIVKYLITTESLVPPGSGERIKRGLFKCTKLNKVFNADLVGAYNNLVNTITPSLWVKPRDRGNGPETRPAGHTLLNGGYVTPNLPALTGATLVPSRAGRRLEFRGFRE